MARMARFNVEVRTRGRVLETLSIESADLGGLRVEVARFVGRLLADHAEQIWVDEDWRVDGTDEDGVILFSIHLFATDSAATTYRKH